MTTGHSHNQPPKQSFRAHNGQEVRYLIRRSQRARSLRITVTPYDGVIVTVPERMRKRIDPVSFLIEKQDWVLKQLEKMNLLNNPEPFGDGSEVWLQGRTYPVSVVEDPRATRVSCGLLLDELCIRVPSDFDGDLASVARQWLKSEAELYITLCAEEWSRTMGVRYNRIAVRSQRTKWGSCSRQGNLSFNWRLVQFPPEVMRYIVIHELCHLRHFNHKPEFWNMVERYEPDYREHIAWLRKNGLRMETSPPAP